MIRPYTMNNSDKKQMEAISDLVYRDFGIFISHEKLSRLEPKLAKLIKNEKYTGLDELYALLASGDRECLDTLIRYITTCHTFFFREADHFQQLVLYMRKRSQPRYLIWSAACSTGEEPYSIAMTLLDEGIHNFHIIASDLNKKVLESFNRGIYHESRLSQIPPVTLLRYFTPRGESYYEIDPELRSYISIKNINLMDPVLFPESVDYIFCRNVFIYFDERSRRLAVSNIVRNLKINGSLFIGHAEVLLRQPDNLKKTGSSIYRRIF